MSASTLQRERWRFFHLYPMVIIVLIYVIGFLLALRMLRVEHEAENRPFTHGDQFMSWAFSAGSFVTVVIILVVTWIKCIGQTGYWTRPIKVEEPAKKEDAK